MIYWFIGQPGCGKTTLSKLLKEKFDGLNKPSIHLDGDILRKIFGNLYSKEHLTQEYRNSNTRILQSFIEHIESQNVNVIVSTVNATRCIREELKERNKNVVEIYVKNTESHIREEFKVENFEEPINNFIEIDTKNLPPDQSFNILCILFNNNKVNI